jgi:hypothetical protein
MPSDSCFVNIMAPFAALLLIHRQRIERIFPALSFGPQSVEATTRHMVEFALAGLQGVARGARGRERDSEG